MEETEIMEAIDAAIKIGDLYRLDLAMKGLNKLLFTEQKINILLEKEKATTEEIEFSKDLFKKTSFLLVVYISARLLGNIFFEDDREKEIEEMEKWIDIYCELIHKIFTEEDVFVELLKEWCKIMRVGDFETRFENLKKLIDQYESVNEKYKPLFLITFGYMYILVYKNAGVPETSKLELFQIFKEKIKDLLKKDQNATEYLLLQAFASEELSNINFPTKEKLLEKYNSLLSILERL